VLHDVEDSRLHLQELSKVREERGEAFIVDEVDSLVFGSAPISFNVMSHHLLSRLLHYSVCNCKEESRILIQIDDFAKQVKKFLDPILKCNRHG
jgi:hypothetical protein